MSTPGGRPHGDEEDIDARFSEIVAGLDWGRLDARTDEDPDADSTAEEHGSDGNAPNEQADNDHDHAPGARAQDADAATPPDTVTGSSHDAPTTPPHTPSEPEGPSHVASSEGINRPPIGWREHEVEDEDDHFVPPPPPPLPAGDLHFWAILIGLTVGPVILILTHVFPLLRGEIWSWLGVLLSVGGFVLLVLRSPTDRDPDATGGARV